MVWRYRLLITLRDLDQLGLDQLRRIALRPHLWDELISRRLHDPGQFGPVLSTKSTITFRANDLGEDEDSNFVPGGRYLLTMNQKRRTFKLWDFGMPGRRLEGAMLVAETQINTEWDPDEWAAAVSGECLRVVILTINSV